MVAHRQQPLLRRSAGLLRQPTSAQRRPLRPHPSGLLPPLVLVLVVRPLASAVVLPLPPRRQVLAVAVAPDSRSEAPMPARRPPRPAEVGSSLVARPRRPAALALRLRQPVASALRQPAALVLALRRRQPVASVLAHLALALVPAGQASMLAPVLAAASAPRPHLPAASVPRPHQPVALTLARPASTRAPATRVGARSSRQDGVRRSLSACPQPPNCATCPPLT